MDIFMQLAEANSLFDRGELRAAAELYKQVIVHVPDNVEALINLGCVYLEMDDLDEAILTFQMVLDKPSGQREAHLNLAMAYFRKESFETAEFHAKIVLSIDKYNQTALLVAALSCLNLQKLGDARKFAETLVLLDSQNPENHLILADIYELSGMRSEVVAHLYQAIELDHGLGELFEKIALIQVELGAIDEAVTAYERRLQDAPRADIILKLYFCYLLVERLDEAAALIEDVVLGDDIPRDYLILLILFLQKGADGIKPHLRTIDPERLPSLADYYFGHTADNSKRITSMIDGYHRVINPPRVVYFAGQHQVTHIRSSGVDLDEKKDVLVWGNDANTKALKSLADLTGFHAVGMVVDRPGASEYEGLPVYGVQEVIDDASLHQTPILCCGSGNAKGDDSFLNILCYLGEEKKLPNRVLHGSCLLDDIKFPPHTHYVLTGYPGSGNLVHYRMLNDMLAGSGSTAADAGLNLCVQLASDYYTSLMAYLDGALEPLGLKSLESSVIFRNAFYGGWGKRGMFVRIYGLPSRFYAMTNLHMTHEPLSADTLEFFEKRNLEPIVFVRHPLDIIISCASKLTHQNPEIILKSLGWFGSMIDILSLYLANYLEVRNRITLFRYEDLLENPTAHILRMAEAVNRRIDEPAALNLWERFGFKSLDPKSPKHLWRPGLNKWSQFLTSRHMDMIKASDLGGIAAEFGYDFNLPLTGNPDFTFSDDLPVDVLYGDFTFHAGMGKKLVTPMSENLIWMDRDQGVMAVGNPEDAVEQARAALQTSRFRQIHGAAFWPERVRTLLV